MTHADRRARGSVHIYIRTMLRFKESLQHLFFKLWIVTLQALQRGSSTEGLCAVGR